MIRLITCLNKKYLVWVTLIIIDVIQVKWYKMVYNLKQSFMKIISRLQIIKNGSF